MAGGKTRAARKRQALGAFLHLQLLERGQSVTGGAQACLLVAEEPHAPAVYGVAVTREDFLEIWFHPYQKYRWSLARSMPKLRSSERSFA